MRKFTILLLLIGILLSAGCSAMQSPDSTVSGFIEAGKKLDLTQMASMVNPSEASSQNKIANMMSNGGTNQSQKLFLAYFQKNAAKITYEIKESKIENDQATVTVAFKYINGKPFLNAVLRDVFSKAYSLASSGAQISDADMEQMLLSSIQEYEKKIQESYTEKTIAIKLIKMDRQWYIDDPSEELVDVFLSDFISVARALNEDINS